MIIASVAADPSPTSMVRSPDHKNPPIPLSKVRVPVEFEFAKIKVLLGRLYGSITGSHDTVDPAEPKVTLRSAPIAMKPALVPVNSTWPAPEPRLRAKLPAANSTRPPLILRTPVVSAFTSLRRKTPSVRMVAPVERALEPDKVRRPVPYL